MQETWVSSSGWGDPLEKIWPRFGLANTINAGWKSQKQLSDFHFVQLLYYHWLITFQIVQQLEKICKILIKLNKFYWEFGIDMYTLLYLK